MHVAGKTTALPEQQKAGPSKFTRRDDLLRIEREMRALWESKRAYEVEALEPTADREKYFCTFPFPYMNGKLHLGHAFSMTKAEFQARYQKLKGKHVLWPFGFHCTGMPIAACADRLKREIAERNRASNAPVAPSPVMPATPSQAMAAAMSITANPVAAKHTAKKTKAVAKTGTVATQWEIMAETGIPQSEIPKFQDPNYWVSYFPEKAVLDLQAFGTAVDWRRSFVTTEVNRYFDRFIKWQFRHLQRRDKIKFGMRPTIFSRRDDQACMDHDRREGEGVNPQEYTLVKMKVIDVPPSWIAAQPLLKDKDIFFVAATLRPETMYGQTNCFLLPEGIYGFYLAFDDPLGVADAKGAEGVLRAVISPGADKEKKCNSVYVCSRRSALNMGYQGIVPLKAPQKGKSGTTGAGSEHAIEESVERGLPQPICLLERSGMDLFGVPLRSPKAIMEKVYTLPMLGISMDKGTGVVTSVPSDAPDDYMALQDLRTKPALREQYKVKEEWLDFDVVEILEIPGLGRRAGVDACIARKIKSQKDKVLLGQAKEECYKRGFYEGVMLLGSQAGKKVCEAKDAVRNEMIRSGQAVAYFEPEGLVVARSGDKCVVAMCNQWYLDYGEENWQKQVIDHLEEPASFRPYNARILSQFSLAIRWLRAWACSRSYGLGTLLPWEEEKGNKCLIESLSDSTIYMAYYTVSHFLQSDLEGKKPGLLGHPPKDFTDDVFDYVFLQSNEIPSNCRISAENLEKMRKAFEYWYPMDMRVSGKDLIYNHLTMSLYNHVAMWPDRPDLWPRSYFCNGYVLVDNAKMSKSAGNFLTLEKVIEEKTADATRVALADAGDSLDDANFSLDTANSAIMKLYLLVGSAESLMDPKARDLNERDHLRTGAKVELDQYFENELKLLVAKTDEAYSKMCYRDALVNGFHDFLTARDEYRLLAGDTRMHWDSVYYFMELQCKILCPIAPHVCEHIWHLLGHETLLVHEAWPSFVEAPYEEVAHREYSLLLASVESFRRAMEKSILSRDVKKMDRNPLSMFEKGVVYVAEEYPENHKVVLGILRELEMDPVTGAPVRADYIKLVKEHESMAKLSKKALSEMMGFATYRIKEELPKRGSAALEDKAPFDEYELFSRYKEVIARLLKLKELRVARASEFLLENPKAAKIPMPESPVIVFATRSSESISDKPGN